MRYFIDSHVRAGVIGMAFAVLALLGACAEIKPFEYRETDEIPEGPGLFTGDEGAFTFGIE